MPPSKPMQYWIATIIAVGGLAVTVWVAYISHPTAPSLPTVTPSNFVQGDIENFDLNNAPICSEPENDGSRPHCLWYQVTVTPKVKHSRFDLSIAVESARTKPKRCTFMKNAYASRLMNSPSSNGKPRPTMRLGCFVPSTNGAFNRSSRAIFTMLSAFT
jgi:hypothetical protein